MKSGQWKKNSSTLYKSCINCTLLAICSNTARDFNIYRHTTYMYACWSHFSHFFSQLSHKRRYIAFYLDKIYYYYCTIRCYSQCYTLNLLHTKRRMLTQRTPTTTFKVIYNSLDCYPKEILCKVKLTCEIYGHLKLL